MKQRSITAVIAIVTITQLMFSGCTKKETKQSETSTSSAEQARTKEEKKARFENSKQDITAKVNGEPISMFYLLRQMNIILPRFVREGEQPSKELLKKIEKEALDMLIFQTLAVQEATKRGMKVKPEEVDAALKNMKSQAGSDKAFQDYIDDLGMSEEEVRKTIEKERLYAMIVAQVGFGDITVSDATLRERYKKEKKNLVTQDAAHRQMSFEESKKLLEQKVRAEAGEKKMREWEQQLKKNARIEFAAG